MSATTSFYITGGTVPPGTPSYVERQADRELFEGLLRGEFCYVLHARQMGKSSHYPVCTGSLHAAACLCYDSAGVPLLDSAAMVQSRWAKQGYGGRLGFPDRHHLDRPIR